MDIFNAMFDEFKVHHEYYQATLSDEDRSNDTKSWYAPKLEQINAFMANVERWIAATEKPAEKLRSTFMANVEKWIATENQDTGHDVHVSSSGFEISDVSLRTPDDGG